MFRVATRLPRFVTRFSTATPAAPAASAAPVEVEENEQPKLSPEHQAALSSLEQEISVYTSRLMQEANKVAPELQQADELHDRFVKLSAEVRDLSVPADDPSRMPEDNDDIQKYRAYSSWLPIPIILSIIIASYVESEHASHPHEHVEAPFLHIMSAAICLCHRQLTFIHLAVTRNSLGVMATVLSLMSVGVSLSSAHSPFAVAMPP